MSNSQIVNEFIMRRCDELFPLGHRYTFINDSNSTRSAIDYMLTNGDQLIGFNVLDIDINLPYLIPVLAICACDVSPTYLCERVKSAAVSADVTHLRWDQDPFE